MTSLRDLELAEAEYTRLVEEEPRCPCTSAFHGGKPCDLDGVIFEGEVTVCNNCAPLGSTGLHFSQFKDYRSPYTPAYSADELEAIRNDSELLWDEFHGRDPAE